MKIEKYKKIKEDVYRIFLDTGEVVDVYEDVIVKNNLLFKKEIDQELLNKITIENNYQEAYNQAIKYIAIRLRSIEEVRVYLERKKYSKEIIDKTLRRLSDNKVLDDKVFASAFIKDKLNFTQKGKYKLKAELAKVKVSNEIISECLDEIEDELWLDRIDKIITRYLNTNKKYSNNVLKNKLYIYLVNLGYDKSLVINRINNIL